MFQTKAKTPRLPGGILFFGQGGLNILENIMESRYIPTLKKAQENETHLSHFSSTTFVREVTAVYRGARRASIKVSGPQAAAHFIRKLLPDNSREHFVALYLDGGHKIIAFSVVSTGTANFCGVHPREIFQMAFLSGAVAIVVAHSHPSGELNPSDADRDFTKTLKEAGQLLRVAILDHVIVTEDGLFSFTEQG